MGMQLLNILNIYFLYIWQFVPECFLRQLYIDKKTINLSTHIKTHSDFIKPMFLLSSKS